MLRGVVLSVAATGVCGFLPPGGRARGALLAVITLGFLVLPLALLIGFRWAPGWISVPENAVSLVGFESAAFANLIPWILTFWIVGVVACLVRLVCGARALSPFLPGTGGEPASGSLLSMARRAAGDIGISLPQVCLSGTSHTPFATGLIRPTVVLPAEATSWSPAVLRAVLLHEMAHIRRGDLWVQAAGNTVCALYWANPLVWFLRRRLAAEREYLADALVIECGVDRRNYAHALLDVAGSLHGPSGGRFAAVGLSGSSKLEERIHRLFKGDSVRRGGRLGVASAVAVSLAAVAAASCLDPFSISSGFLNEHGENGEKTAPGSPVWTEDEIKTRLSASPFPGA